MDNFGFPDKTQEWSQYNGPVLSVLQDAPVIYWDLKTQQNAEVTLTANRTLGNPIGIRKGRTYTLNVVQDSAGSRTLTLDTAYSGTVALATAAGARTRLRFFANTDTTLSLIAIAFTNVVNTFTVPQRTTEVTDNDGSFDLNAGPDFEFTPTGAVAITFINIPASPTVQKGSILLVNGSNYAITAHANTKVTSALLAALSVTGTYVVAYESRNGVVYIASAGAMS